MWTMILTSLGCGQPNGKDASLNSVQPAKAEQYVSMDCPAGDITLTLGSDQTFDLTILFWDENTNQHTGQETIKGHWTKANRFVTLTSSDNNKIVYELTTTHMKIGLNEINAITYGFISNDHDTFASGYGLLEKEQTDEFLLRAAKQK